MLDTFEDQLDDAINTLMDDYMEDLLTTEDKTVTIHTAMYNMNWYNRHSNR